MDINANFGDHCLSCPVFVCWSNLIGLMLNPDIYELCDACLPDFGRVESHMHCRKARTKSEIE